MRLTADESKRILDLASKNELDMNIFEGVTNDSYIIYNNKVIQVDGQATKYIIMLNKPLNVWQSGHTLITTDSDDEYNKLYDELTSDEIAV